MHANSTLPVGRGILYILAAAVAWGTGGAVAAVLYDTSGLGPIAVSFWRFAVAVPLLAAIHLWTGRGRPVAARGWRRVVAIGVGLAIYQTAYFAAVGFAGLAMATVVTLGAGPILIALGARITTGERLGRGGVVTMAMALAGLLVLVGGGGAAGGPAPALGLACALLSATGYAIVTLASRGSDGPSTTLAAFTVGLVCLLPAALIEGLLPTSGDLGHVWAMLAYLGVVPTALAYVLFFAGLKVVRSTTAAVLTLVEPIAAAAIAVLWLDERLTVSAAGGSVLLVGAVLALTLAERRATAPRPTAMPADPSPSPANTR